MAKVLTYQEFKTLWDNPVHSCIVCNEDTTIPLEDYNDIVYCEECE